MTATMTFAHTHASGRFNVTKAQEEQALDEYMSDSDLVTVTEVGKNTIARCLNEPGWKAVFGNKGARDDCGIAVRLSTFDVLDSDTQTLSPLRYKTEAGNLSDTTEGAYAVLRHVHTDVIGVVVVVHMPHGMQNELRTGRIRSDVARAYRDIMKGARRLANRLTKKHDASWAMIVGDWNLNLKNAWVASFLKVNFPAYHPNFSKPYPVRGTFNNMIFDIALLRMINVKKGPVILRHEPGFDHVGWRQVLG